MRENNTLQCVFQLQPVRQGTAIIYEFGFFKKNYLNTGNSIENQGYLSTSHFYTVPFQTRVVILCLSAVMSYEIVMYSKHSSLIDISVLENEGLVCYVRTTVKGHKLKCM